MQNSEFFESVCINCPGSLWGEKSICRIHGKSIGEITSCEEWTKHTPNLSIKNGQVAFSDLEPALEIVQKTEEDLRSYHWMIKEIDRLQKELDKAIKYIGFNSPLVAQYGDEAGMPRAQGTKPSTTLTISEEKYERQFKRLQGLEMKLRKINQAVEQITDEKEKTVMECILDGERMNIIARHVGVSRTRLNEIKRTIVIHAAKVLYPEEMQR
ncbi:hypothetical protein J7E66_10430 [Bacillus sp. ISL-7]|nr:hypothetical protein [Bacillus sp. ISL-7]